MAEPILPGIVQDALSRIGALLDTLFQEAEDAIFLMDGTHFVDCNPATLHMFGCHTKEEIIGQTPFAFSPARQPDGASSDEKATRFVAAALDGVPQHFEWQHCRLDRTAFDVEVKLNRFTVGSAVLLVAVVRDITARKRAEEALQHNCLADQLINQVLARCASCTPRRLDENMLSALQELAAFMGVEHAYFFMTSPDRTTYSCTHETCGPSVAPLRPHYQGVRTGTNAWIEPTLLAGEIARIDSLGDAHAAAAAGYCVSGADVGRSSLLLVPTSNSSGKHAGALGVDSHAQQVKWTDDDVRLCSIIGNALTGMTERERIADSLLREKLFSERLIDCLPGILYLYDSNLRMRRWNKNYEVMGYTAEELRGKRMADWFATEEHRYRAIAAAHRVLRGGKTEFLQTELRQKDGSVVPYLCTGVRVDSPTGPMLLGVGINIAERIQAETALAASERNYRELFNATTEALVVQDVDGRVVDVNRSACAMFGFGVAQARSLSFSDLSLGEPPYSQTEVLEKIRRAIHEGPQVFDWHSRRRDDTLFWSETALRACRIGGVERIIASVRDITERKLAALEHERLMAEVQAASSAKDQFLAVLSHELRNPLAAIQAGVGLLRLVATAKDPAGLRAVDVIERNVKLQARLVNDLLDLSRLARGKLSIVSAPVQLDSLVLSAVQACGADAARAGIALEAQAESGLWINADSDRIQQVVINLVDNGIKFTPRGGRVTVSVAATEHIAHIIVADTGMGIEPDRLPSLFEMFRQGQVAAQRAPGLGIGLALVKSIVELHGGRVLAESPGPDRGSRFTVELPLCEAPTVRRAPQASGSQRPPISMLLVEDNNDTRTMLAETFSRRDYKVFPVESAEAALAILAREAVDVILADIGLPGMDGYELMRQARRLPAAAHVPAIALTGYGQAIDIRRARDAGYGDHFIKPVNIEELDQRIRSRLPPVPA